MQKSRGRYHHRHIADFELSCILAVTSSSKAPIHPRGSGVTSHKAGSPKVALANCFLLVKRETSEEERRQGSVRFPSLARVAFRLYPRSARTWLRNPSYCRFLFPKIQCLGFHSFKLLPHSIFLVILRCRSFLSPSSISWIVGIALAIRQDAVSFVVVAAMPGCTAASAGRTRPHRSSRLWRKFERDYISNEMLAIG